MNKITIPLIAFLFFSKMLAAQVDTVPPVIVCKNQMPLPIHFCFGTYWLTDFIDTFYDNQTPAQVLQFGIRKACTGFGFPENTANVTLAAGEGTSLEIWVKDTSGNTNSCSINVLPYDADGNCDLGYEFHAQTPPDDLSPSDIFHIDYFVGGSNCHSDSFDFHINTGNQGMFFNFGTLIPSAGYNSTIIPSKNINPLNGVSTYDLVLIQKHILGIEPLDSPWKIIAADANQDGKVTTFDIITLRKLILGITTELPNGKSWRFAPKDYVFPNPLNPFQPPFPERIEVPNTADPAPNSFKFTGVKIGDVDFSADPNQ